MPFGMSGGGDFGGDFGMSGGFSGNSPKDFSIGPAGEIGGVMPGGGAAFGDSLTFGQGLGLSALSGLFSAIGGILAAQEAGRQAIKVKQTPANVPASVQAAANVRRFAPPTRYAPSQPQAAPAQASYASQPVAPMLSRPDSGRNAMAGQLQQKMQAMLASQDSPFSPQLKASRYAANIGRA